MPVYSKKFEGIKKLTLDEIWKMIFDNFYVHVTTDAQQCLLKC